MYMIYTVYVLRSLKNGKRYVGYTGKDVKERLHEHLSGSNKWTRHNGPFVIIHTIHFSDKFDAIKYERYLKSGVGRRWMDSNIPG